MNNITKITKLIEDNEKFALVIFANKLNTALNTYPEDQTIGKMADIANRMAGKDRLFITRAEIRDLYNRLYSRNTKFPELFKTELGNIEKLASPKLYDRTGEDDNYDIVKKAFDQVVDPTLSNALNSAFGNPTKGYSDKYAENAKQACIQVCSIYKLAAKIDVISGNEHLIICNATFETPKGQTVVYIPVEIVSNKILLPSTFIGNNGKQDISKNNIDNYIKANAGKKLNVSDKIILKSANNTSKISDVDLAFTKFAAQKESKSEYFSNNVIHQNMEKEDTKLVVNTPTYQDKEVESFANMLDTASGIANFKFGKDKINATKKLIENELSAMGIKNVQIVVCDISDDKVVYAVSLGKTAFKVPVDITKTVIPSILISNGSIRDFSNKSILDLFKEETIDYKTASFTSPLYGLKASELVNIVRQAMAEQNYVKAEDALNVLENGNDERAYQTAFKEYSNGLNGIKKEEATKCSMIVKNSSSKHLICGHTGLPLHKVYVDKYGNCQPKYRQEMSDTYEGASFLNSKIFF